MRVELRTRSPSFRLCQRKDLVNLVLERLGFGRFDSVERLHRPDRTESFFRHRNHVSNCLLSLPRELLEEPTVENGSDRNWRHCN